MPITSPLLHNRLAIFENLFTGNVKSNGQPKFEHVLKKMVPGPTGIEVGKLIANETHFFDFSYTFNGDYYLPKDSKTPADHTTNHTVEEFSDLGVVVWLQGKSERKVYQSTYARSGSAILEADHVSGVDEFTIYPNPSNETTRLIFSLATDNGNSANICITDNYDTVIYERIMEIIGDSRAILSLDTQDLTGGLYVITIKTNKGQRSEKLSIIH